MLEVAANIFGHTVCLACILFTTAILGDIGGSWKHADLLVLCLAISLAVVVGFTGIARLVSR